MIEIEVEFLTGRYVATSVTHRDRSEWPPHPARVFSALVAAAADNSTAGAEVVGAEREALEWLELLPAPEIDASRAVERTAVTYYVPVNDVSVVGLAETTRRAAKLDQFHAELAELDGADDARSVRRVATLADKITATRDVTSKVTVPGSTNPSAAEKLLPSGRGRQPRQWPSVTPDEPVVTYRWPSADPSPAMLAALDGLCARVARLGHSSSLVSMRARRQGGTAEGARWVPDASGPVTFRWVQQGQVRALEQAHEQHQASRPRSLPSIGVAYSDTTTPAAAPASPAVARSNLAGEWHVFQLPPDGRRLPVTVTVDLATRLRKALLSHAEEPIHPVVSGHDANGRPSSDPHLAFLGLPFVGHEQATGQLLGLAVLLPTDLDPAALHAARVAVARWREAGAVLNRGRHGRLHLAHIGTVPSDLQGLRRQPWSTPARTWVSATPLALPRHPGDLTTGTAQSRNRAWAKAEAAVVACCGHVDLPEPARIELSHSPLLAGAEPAGRYPTFKQGRQARALLHASITFDEPVAGPIVLGSGRFFGLGLFRPVTTPTEHHP